MALDFKWCRVALGALTLAAVACGSEEPTDRNGGPAVAGGDGGGAPAHEAGVGPSLEAGSPAGDDGAIQPATQDAGAARPDASGTTLDASAPASDAGTTPVSDATIGDASAAPDAAPHVACNPADKKPDPTNVPVSAIKRYQGMVVAPAKGPYKPVLESDPGFPDWTVYRPEKLGEVKHPIVVWANGGCIRDGTYFSKFLLELASHGFVAVADGKPNGSGMRGLGPDGAPQISALDWIIAENERPCSQYYHKLDVTKTAAAGQSCGGLMTLGASKDERLTTVAIFNSGLFERNQAIYSALHTPIAYFIGGADDVAYAQAQEDTKAINNVPLFYGNLDVGHFATWAQDNAGEFGRVGVGWFKWQLMGDATAQKMFSGADCELCKPPSEWKVVKKMMQ